MVKFHIKCKTGKDVSELCGLLGSFDKKRLQSMRYNDDNSVTVILKDISQKTGKYILDKESLH